MKKLLLISIIIGFAFLTNAYDKLSLVERFTNASCGPCAQINNAWYNATTQNLVNTGSMSHIVYNVWWPGANDPMYLLNQFDNTSRTNYYGCNSVPWIEVNATHIANSQAALTSSVTSGNSQFAPFNLVIAQGVISNNLIEVQVKIIRDPLDVTNFGDVKLRVALTEKTVSYSFPPGGNGESEFYSICRKMMPSAAGTSFTIPAPGDSVTINLQYVPSADFIQLVNLDSLRVVAFVQDDNTKETYQSAMHNLNQNYMATINSEDEYYFGASSETANYTAYIKNIGQFQDTYNINLDIDCPSGWSQTFTTVNGTFNYGQTDAVTLNPGDSTEVEIAVSPNSVNGFGKTYLQFISNNGSFGTVGFKFTTFGLDILVVDDDGGKDYQHYFENELITLNSEYGTITSDYIPSNVASINTFNIIIWNTADTEPGLSSDEIIVLKTFLDNGGKLYLNGVDIAFQLADPTSTYYTSETNDFFTNYLHSSYILKENTSLIAQGITGDPITDGLGTMTLVGGTGGNTINHSEGHFVNQISAAGMNSNDILSFWLKPDEHSGVRAIHGMSGKVVFTTFGFETIAQADRRTAFAERIINWLDSPVGVDENEPNNIPESFELQQNFPNPFNPSTTIKYNIPQTSFVSIKVYDLIGKEIATIVNEVKQSGIHQVSFNGENLSSGVYFYKMSAGEHTVVKKMNLLK